MAVIQVRRDSRCMFFKLNHDEEDFTECDFLKKKVKNEHKELIHILLKCAIINANLIIGNHGVP